MAEASGLLLLNAEDNSLSGLTLTQEGSNLISITAGAACHGLLGYNFAFSGNAGENILAAVKGFTEGVDIYARLYFYIPTSFGCNDSYLTIISLNNASPYNNYLVFPRFKSVSNAITIDRFYYYINTGVTYLALTSPPAISKGVWHSVEIRHKAGASDGIAELWLDETAIASITGLANNNYGADYIAFGNSQAGVPTSGSVILIDDVKVDTSRIGAYSDISSGGGILVGDSALVGGSLLCGQGVLIG